MMNSIPDTTENPRIRLAFRLATGEVAPGAVVLTRRLLVPQAAVVVCELLELMGVRLLPPDGQSPQDAYVQNWRLVQALTLQAFGYVVASPHVDAVIIEPDSGVWSAHAVKIRPNGAFLLLDVQVRNPA